jgi:hypothetical protein
MDEKQYFELCNECDKIIYNAKGDYRIIANSWLHIIREHPVFLKKYEKLFDFEYQIISHIVIRLGVFFTYSVKLVIHLFYSFFVGTEHFFSTKEIDNNLDFLFISHLINTNDVGKEKDFYFGSIISDLEEDGLKVSVGLINYTKIRSKSLASEWRNNKVNRFIFSKSLYILDELKLTIDLLTASIQILKFKVSGDGNSLGFQVNRYAVVESLSLNSLSNVRMYKQIEKLVLMYRPKYIITTCEGHAWERLVYAAAKKNNPNIICLGYIHAAVFRLQHAMRRNINFSFDPDIYLFAGKNAYNTIGKDDKLKRKYILGSDRGVEFRSNLEENNMKMFQNRKLSILVAPEGIMRECFLLFDYSLDQAIKNKEIQFTWKLHPILNKSLFKKRYNNLPNNVEWEDNATELNFSNYSYVLYRGTTLVIKAVLNKLQPIYFQIKSELSIDILYEIDDFKIKVNQEGSLIEAIRKFNEKDLHEVYIEFNNLKDFCNDYYWNFNPLIIKNLPLA